MEATAPVPPIKKIIEPPFSGGLPQKIQNHQASLLPESPLKDFKLPVMDCSCATFHMKHKVTKHLFAEYQLVTCQ